MKIKQKLEYDYFLMAQQSKVKFPYTNFRKRYELTVFWLPGTVIPALRPHILDLSPVGIKRKNRWGNIYYSNKRINGCYYM